MVTNPIPLTYDLSVEDRANWLVDAVAMSTQNRMFLRGDPAEDKLATEAIYLNAKQALHHAVSMALSTASKENDDHGPVTDALWQAWDVLNAIRARDGAPDGWSEEYFEKIVEDAGKQLGGFHQPWHPRYVRESRNKLKGKI